MNTTTSAAARRAARAGQPGRFAHTLRLLALWLLLPGLALAQAPTLTALAPFIGQPGSRIALTGTNLTGTTSITFTGSAGVKTVSTGFVVVSSTRITGVLVPAGAQTGPVRATTGSGTSAVSGAVVFARATSLATGYNHTVAVRADGTLWAWGSDSDGQLGKGANTTVTPDDRPAQIGTATTWASAAAGELHTVAVRTDGTLWAWGSNANGRLGKGANPTVTPDDRPAQIGTATTWASVAAGGAHTMAVRADGSLYTWGSNFYGQLGQGNSGTANDLSSPTRVGTGNGWASVSAGQFHSVAVQANGSLWAWGLNFDGQLGLSDSGNMTDRNVPTLVPGATNWVSAAAGSGHTVAVRADGTLWAWGNNDFGQLGNGGATPNTPTQVGTATTWASAAAGDVHTVAVRADGTLWAWGSNSDGQLGDGSTTQRNAPTQVGTANSWLRAAAGSAHSAGEQTCQANWAWGNNDFGQVGDASSAQRNAPVPVYTPPAVALLSFSPSSAGPGSTVVVTGTSLFNITSLSVNGAAVPLADITNNTNTGFSFVVPLAVPAVPTGTTNVVSSCGTASSTGFTVLPPVLTSLSLAISSVGVSLTLTGSNLTGAGAVTFSGSANNTVTTGLTVSGTGSNQTITVTVPSGAVTGTVTMTALGGPSNGLAFTVLPAMSITSTSPAANARAAAAGGPVVVTFNQPILASTAAALKVFSAQRGGLRTNGSGSTTVSGSTVRFTPTYAFRPGETVQATVTTAATSGVSLLRARVLQFTTAVSSSLGVFGGGSNPTVGSNPRSVATGDVDGDGDLDMLVSSSYFFTGTVQVRLNNGSGAFTFNQDVGVGTSPKGVVLGDVDGDGDLDFVAANDGDNTVSVRLNNGIGAFGGGSEVAVGNQPYGVALGDVDGDGDLDLLTANGGNVNVSVRLNDGSGAFGGGQDVGVGFIPQSVALGDVDGDGDLDMLAANQRSGTVSVRLNNGSGAFGGGSDVATGDPQSVALGDVDGDGDLDFVAANDGGGTVSVRLNNGSGAFGGGSDVAVGSRPYSVALGDVDGDGDLDFITANYDANTASVRLNNGSGVFGGGSDPAVGSQPISVALGDVDGDGDLDVLTANAGNATVGVRFNQNLPVLTGLSPASGAVGSSVTLTGSNLGGATAVTFSGSANNVVTTGLTVSGTGSKPDHYGAGAQRGGDRQCEREHSLWHQQRAGLCGGSARAGQHQSGHQLGGRERDHHRQRPGWGHCRNFQRQRQQHRDHRSDGERHGQHPDHHRDCAERGRDRQRDRDHGRRPEQRAGLYGSAGAAHQQHQPGGQYAGGSGERAGGGDVQPSGGGRLGGGAQGVQRPAGRAAHQWQRQHDRERQHRALRADVWL